MDYKTKSCNDGNMVLTLLMRFTTFIHLMKQGFTGVSLSAILLAKMHGPKVMIKWCHFGPVNKSPAFAGAGS